MIERLEISDLGPVREVDLPLAAGLVVVTGESGAGKSLLLRAIDAAVGGRMDAGWVRPGGPSCRIRLRLRQADGAVRVLEREIRGDGRSTARLDGRAVSLAALRAVGETALGGGRQGDVYRLREDGARAWLDQAPGVSGPLGEVAEIARRHAALREEAGSLGPVSDVERTRRVENLMATVAEIDAASPTPGEWDALQAELRRLEGVEDLIRAVAAARECLSPEAEGEGARELIGRSVHALSDAGRLTDDLDEIRSGLEGVRERVQELSRDLGHYLDRLEPDPAREAAVRERLGRLGPILRRFGPGEADVLEARDRAREELDRLEATANRARAVDDELGGLETRYREAAATLSAARTRAARKLEVRVREGLAALMLPDSQFRIVVEEDADHAVDPFGTDRVALLFASSPQAALRPLAETASGGEAARVLLALEGALAEAGGTRTWTFDEVEAGVGGEAAWAVADALHRLATGRQVLVVTHQAALAAVADQHVAVVKTHAKDDGMPDSRARVLEEEGERLQELARMLSGGGEEAVKHARALLDRRRTNSRPA